MKFPTSFSVSPLEAVWEVWSILSRALLMFMAHTCSPSCGHSAVTFPLRRENLRRVPSRDSLGEKEKHTILSPWGRQDLQTDKPCWFCWTNYLGQCIALNTNNDYRIIIWCHMYWSQHHLRLLKRSTECSFWEEILFICEFLIWDAGTHQDNTLLITGLKFKCFYRKTVKRTVRIKVKHEHNKCLE